MSSLHLDNPYITKKAYVPLGFVKHYGQEPVMKRQERLRERLIRYLCDISSNAFDF